ncbi:MAG: tRNA/rRNA methyltransferase [Gammaproteobacteria bacterium]|nr:tRNA/rRNA methyltransferase [Gammaproteobacteria bacterium]
MNPRPPRRGPAREGTNSNDKPSRNKAPRGDNPRQPRAEGGERSRRLSLDDLQPNRPPRPAKPAGRPARGEAPRGELVLEEGKIYGINACLKCYELRPEALIRAYFTADTARRFGEVMKFLAANRLAYHVVEEEEMERITASGHHEGVCFLIKKAPALPAGAWLKAHGRQRQQAVLVLENVGNPHNLGAILRICAHFGVKAVAINEPAAMSSGAALRTAEGGAEFVDVLAYTNLEQLLAEFKQAGFAILTTTSHGGTDLFLSRMPDKALILFGEESRGLSRHALASGDLRLKIPGTDRVESLNVSTAAAIILAEYWRQHA